MHMQGIYTITMIMTWDWGTISTAFKHAWDNYLFRQQAISNLEYDTLG